MPELYEVQLILAVQGHVPFQETRDVDPMLDQCCSPRCWLSIGPTLARLMFAGPGQKQGHCHTYVCTD